MKIASTWLVYASLLFLCVALSRADYLKLPVIISPLLCGASLAFLFAGFVADAWAWRSLAAACGLRCSLRDSLAGCGLSIFGKYIPGKVWMVVGRAAYCAERGGGAFKDYSLVALTGQLITLWLGLALGAMGLLAIGAWRLWGPATLALWLAVSVLLFTRVAHRAAERVSSRLLRRSIELPGPRAAIVLAATPPYLANWLLWAIGFFLLAQSLSPSAAPASLSLAFPLSAVLGILAILAPGGLGVREGVLVGYLRMTGIELDDAVTLAAASRLWFFLGEAFAFAVGAACHSRPAGAPA